jgi:hypothetical protein
MTEQFRIMGVQPKGERGNHLQIIERSLVTIAVFDDAARVSVVQDFVLKNRTNVCSDGRTCPALYFKQLLI